MDLSLIFISQMVSRKSIYEQKNLFGCELKIIKMCFHFIQAQSILGFFWKKKLGIEKNDYRPNKKRAKALHGKEMPIRDYFLRATVFG